MRTHGATRLANRSSWSRNLTSLGNRRSFCQRGPAVEAKPVMGVFRELLSEIVDSVAFSVCSTHFAKTE